MAGKQTYELKGVIPAIITPMDEWGKVNFNLLEKQAAYLSEAGVDGFFICGTTAEGAYLDSEEKGEIFKVVRRVTQGRQFLCAAFIRPSTIEVLKEMSALGKNEPDYVVAVTPYYLSVRQEDIMAHYRTIAKDAPAPLILYNIPANTHNPITLETILELAGEKNIVGIKDSTGDFIQFSRGVLGDSQEGFSWIQGEDYLDGPSLMVGCDGIVTGLGNARIKPYVEMYRAAQKRDWQTVLECQTRINRLYEIIRLCDNPIAAAKAAAELAGRGSRWMRQKTLSLSDDQMARVAEILQDFDEIRAE